jgi:hypothetical protein
VWGASVQGAVPDDLLFNSVPKYILQDFLAQVFNNDGKFTNKIHT